MVVAMLESPPAHFSISYKGKCLVSSSDSSTTDPNNLRFGIEAWVGEVYSDKGAIQPRSQGCIRTRVETEVENR